MVSEQNCIRISFTDPSRDDAYKIRVLLGLLESEDAYFFVIKTSSQVYRIAKSTVLSIQPTGIPFKERHLEEAEN